VEPLVPVSELVTSTTAALATAAAAVLQAPSSWPEPAIGLAYRIFARAGVPAVPSMTQPLRPTTETLLRRTPEIAAFGYVLDRVDATVLDLWADAVERLRGREIYPGDRQSFVFNPLELLGLAAGLSCSSGSSEHREWLASTISRGIRQEQFRTPVSHLAALTALAAMDDAEARRQETFFIDTDSLSTPDLILASAIELAFGELTAGDEMRIESALLSRALRTSIAIGDAAEAAALVVMAGRVTDRVQLTSAGTPSVDLIGALCRRFPLLVERLRKRQRKRAPIVVRDEYDVQDLMHGILKLHFDDVRPEEWTPSYAGNSSRVDFYLPRERIVVEAKMTRPGLGQKEVVNQLLIDVARYAQMQSVDTLVCLVYDPERRCGNPATLENDIESSAGRLRIRVVVCPRGL
jgi:hypothetical protein